MMEYYNGIEELLGNTPMVKLNRLFPKANVFGKLEYYNPTFSVKDRIAFYILEKALEEGKINQDTLIIEATSGNTGLGLCLATKALGLNLICVTFNDVPQEKRNFLKACGAIVLECESQFISDQKNGYIWVAQQIAKRFKNVYLVDQFNSPYNPEAHYRITGPEIWKQMAGKIDYFIATVGTGGTMSGIAKFLKEKSKSIQIIGVEPLGGIYANTFHDKAENEYQDHMIHAISDNFISKNLDFSILDDFIAVEDSESFKACYSILQQEKICIGTSSGCALAGVSQFIAKIENSHDRNVVVMLPDSGMMYKETLFGSQSETFIKYFPKQESKVVEDHVDTISRYLDNESVPFKFT